MKLVGCVLLLLFTVPLTFSTEALDYTLRAIDYLASVDSGVFSCVFWDISALGSHDNILDAILESKRLIRVIYYVVSGFDLEMIEKLGWNLSLLLIYPGNDVNHLEHNETRQNLSSSLRLFSPTTKVLVFSDLDNVELIQCLGVRIYNVIFAYFVFIDSSNMRLIQCNGVNNWVWPRVLPPLYLFTWNRRWMAGRNITYVKNEDTLAFSYNRYWVEETARYLKTEAVELQHSCFSSGKAYLKCLEDHRRNGFSYDIIFVHCKLRTEFYRNFRVLYTTIPSIREIAVPRDRPLNVAELLVMPFSWEVWTLLVAILVSAEIIKHLFPDQFKNNPTLLAVCGYERHDLHQAGRLEKFTFISLIILMFFMTNAFETKIVSLMVSKPSIQRIKTLDDFLNSDLKIYFDLEENPSFRNHSIVGKMVTHSKTPGIYDSTPGVAYQWISEFVDLRLYLTFDFKRLQPFYVMLDYRYFDNFEIYWTEGRFLFVEVLRDTHLTFVEAGLMDLWKQWWKADMRSKFLGRRPRKDINNKTDLDFEDIQPAWVVLAIGLCISSVGFFLEILRNYFAHRKQSGSTWRSSP